MSESVLTQLQQTLDMFLFLAVEITVLFLLISYLIGVVLEFLPRERIQRTLSARFGLGYLAAALLGVLTPFCSCSTIPMLTGQLKARAGFGPTLAFLFGSPLLNPVVLGLFVATFSLNIALTYAAIALAAALFGGWLLNQLGFERYVRQEVVNGQTVSGDCGPSTGCGDNSVNKVSQTAACTEASCSELSGAELCCDGSVALIPAAENRWLRIWQETWAQFVSVSPYVALGITLGAITYGFMPADLIAQFAGPDNPLAIPVAAVIGVPLYISAEAMIPLSSVLAEKGMGLGAIMALIIGSAGASLTEVILLRSIFRTPMVLAFLVVVFGMAILCGFLFNLFF